MPTTLEATGSPAKARKRKTQREKATRSVERVMTVLSAVQAWAEANTRLTRVYVTLDAEHDVFCLHAVSAHSTYDFELTTSVTNLASALTDRGIDTVGSRLPDVPAEEMTAFFDPSNSFIIHRR